MNKKTGGSIVALAGVLLAVGCGGSESDSATVAALSFDPSITHAQYRQKADKICNEAKTEWLNTLQKVAKEEGKGSVVQVPPEKQAEILLTSMRTAFQKILEVAAPAKDKEPVEKFVRTFQSSIDAIEKAERLTAQEIEPAFVRIARAAAADGLTRCEFG